MANQILTQARTEQISEMLTANPERACKLLALNPEEALKEINGGLGFDFTIEEIKEYGKVLTNAVKLSDAALSGVAGGVASDMEEDSPMRVVETVVVVIDAALRIRDIWA